MKDCDLRKEKEMTDKCAGCVKYVPEVKLVCPGCENKVAAVHVKDKKTAILECLKKYHTGKRNAVHSAELERLFSMDDRAVRRKISALRKDGHPICSGDVGYYYAENKKEINTTVNRLNDLMTGVSDARTGLLFSYFPVSAMEIEISVKVSGGEN